MISVQEFLLDNIVCVHLFSLFIKSLTTLVGPYSYKILVNANLTQPAASLSPPPPQPPQKALLGLRLCSQLLTYRHPFQTVKELTWLTLKLKRRKLVSCVFARKRQKRRSIVARQTAGRQKRRGLRTDTTRAAFLQRPVDPSSGALGRQLNVITDVPGPRAFCPRRPTQHTSRAR